MSNLEIEAALKKMGEAESEKLFNFINKNIPEFKKGDKLSEADIDRILPRQAD